MPHRFAKAVYHLRLPFVLAVLFLAAMTSIPTDSAAVVCPSACDVQYYYDASRSLTGTRQLTTKRSPSAVNIATERTTA